MVIITSQYIKILNHYIGIPESNMLYVNYISKKIGDFFQSPVLTGRQKIRMVFQEIKIRKKYDGNNVPDYLGQF